MVLLAWLACTDDVEPETEVERVVVEVDHGPGAPPRTGSYGGVGDIWSLTQANLDALFAGLPVDVPHDLGDMEALPALPEGADGRFTTEELLAVADRHRNTRTGDGTESIYLVFVDGIFRDSEGNDAPQVLGVSLGNTGVVAIFTPVVDGAARLEATRAFVEQTTVIHEVGHAVGLVNNGLPMVEPHEDPQNPRHDVSSDCVMYWANEGAADLVAFVNQVVVEDSVVLFDDACIADAAARYATP